MRIGRSHQGKNTGGNGKGLLHDGGCDNMLAVTAVAGEVRVKPGNPQRRVGQNWICRG